MFLIFVLFFRHMVVLWPNKANQSIKTFEQLLLLEHIATACVIEIELILNLLL